MLANPKPGQLVEIRYRAALRPIARLHGRLGVVRIVGKGKPRNHGVEVDGRLYCVPCGQLNKVEGIESALTTTTESAQ